jgi:hypothetical protein
MQTPLAMTARYRSASLGRTVRHVNHYDQEGVSDFVSDRSPIRVSITVVLLCGLSHQFVQCKPTQATLSWQARYKLEL